MKTHIPAATTDSDNRKLTGKTLCGKPITLMTTIGPTADADCAMCRRNARSINGFMRNGTDLAFANN